MRFLAAIWWTLFLPTAAMFVWLARPAPSPALTPQFVLTADPETPVRALPARPPPSPAARPGQESAADSPPPAAPRPSTAKKPPRRVGDRTLGLAAQHRGDHGEALAHFERAVRTAPGDRSSWFHLGLARLKTDRPAAAAEALEHAIELRPGFAACYNHGLALMRSSRTAGALEAFERAWQFQPRNRKVLHQLCALAPGAGRRELAARAAVALVEVDPESPAAGRVARRLYEDEALPAALRVFAALREAHAGADPRFGTMEALTLSRLGQPDRAVARYRDVLRLHPGHATARRNVAAVLGRLGRHTEAEVHYRILVGANPSDTRARYSLARCLCAQGRAEEAVMVLGALLAIDPEHKAAIARLNRIHRSMADEPPAPAAPRDLSSRGRPRVRGFIGDRVNRTYDHARACRLDLQRQGWFLSGVAAPRVGYVSNAYLSPDSALGLTDLVKDSFFYGLAIDVEGARELDWGRTGLNLTLEQLWYERNSNLDSGRQELEFWLETPAGSDLKLDSSLRWRHQNDNVVDIFGNPRSGAFGDFDDEIEERGGFGYHSFSAETDLTWSPAPEWSLEALLGLEFRDYRDRIVTSLDRWSPTLGARLRFNPSDRITLRLWYDLEWRNYLDNPSTGADGTTSLRNPDERHVFHDLLLWGSWQVSDRLDFDVQLRAAIGRDRFADYESYKSLGGEVGIGYALAPSTRIETSVFYQYRDFDNRPAGPGRTLAYHRFGGELALNHAFSEDLVGTLSYRFVRRDSNRPTGSSYRDYESHGIELFLSRAF